MQPIEANHDALILYLIIASVFLIGWIIKREIKFYRDKKKDIIGGVGDVITWDFKDSIFDGYPEFLKGKVFSADIAMVDLENKEYGIYAEYGQDLIPFDKCKLRIVKRKNNSILYSG